MEVTMNCTRIKPMEHEYIEIEIAVKLDGQEGFQIFRDSVYVGKDDRLQAYALGVGLQHIGKAISEQASAGKPHTFVDMLGQRRYKF